jgi:ATP-binding cassette subfamily B protein
MYFGGVLIYWKGGIAVVQGDISLGELTLFIAFLWKFYQPIQRLSQLTDQLEIAATAAERIFEVLDSTPEVHDHKDARDMKDMRGQVSLKNLSFSYSPENRVLHDINLEIKAGEMIGLAGPSGSGKTTLTKLISRFYDPEEGTVKIDGIDVRKIKQKSLRQRIGVVLQEPFLFHGTIAENIAYGRPRAKRKEIIQAAKAANAHDFILRLPDGYDTQVGERGTRLSGGEKQRISIARAIVNRPSIIILDEATSSLDTVTEKMIQEALQRLVKGRTTIAIAHRLSTLSNADRLVIMEEGRIVEMGTHEELIERGGMFSNLLGMQQELAKVRTT